MARFSGGSSLPMRLHLKLGLANGLDHLGIVAALRRLRFKKRAAILTFHRVLPEQEKASCYEPHLMISAAVFQELLLLLCREFQITSLRNVLDHPEGCSGRQCIALTFDDGWIDTYTTAYPILLRYQLPATVFLCTGLMDTNQLLPEERLFRIWKRCSSEERIPQLLCDMRNWGLPNSSATGLAFWARENKKLPLETKLLMLGHLETVYSVPNDGQCRFLTWEQARIMAQNQVTFGSHTVHHSTLSAENELTILRELQDSHRLIREKLGVQPEFVAYPNGAYDARVISAAKQAGFTHGFTIERGLFTHTTPPHVIPRICMEDSALVGRSPKLHPSRARLYLQPLFTRWSSPSARFNV
jgi:peptidoglycan/xylan/chitin deacetylase (PgdA/CDA1 family)